MEPEIGKRSTGKIITGDFDQLEIFFLLEKKESEEEDINEFFFFFFWFLKIDMIDDKTFGKISLLVR